ncbi:MAG: hypothetical protein ACK5PJ_00545 [Ralstonia sp.]
MSDCLAGTWPVGININGTGSNAALGSNITVSDNRFLNSGGTITARYNFAAAAAPVVRDFVPMTVAQLPGNAGNGSLMFASDGKATNWAGLNFTAITGGNGCLVQRAAGAWLATTPS